MNLSGYITYCWHNAVPPVPLPEPVNRSSVVREIFDSKKSNKQRKVLVFKEGDDITAIKAADTSVLDVHDYFGKSYAFFFEVFNRDSIDNEGHHLIASVHYDDDNRPPGMDNAFWDGDEMAFGDGDGEIFGSNIILYHFWRCVLLTFTQASPRILMSLAMSWVMEWSSTDLSSNTNTNPVLWTNRWPMFLVSWSSSTFILMANSLLKTLTGAYFSLAASDCLLDASWPPSAHRLIGEGIFLPTLKNAGSLRSMKSPGTAYNNPKIGKDRQPASMDKYAKLPNTSSGDWVRPVCQHYPASLTRTRAVFTSIQASPIMCFI